MFVESYFSKCFWWLLRNKMLQVLWFLLLLSLTMTIIFSNRDVVQNWPFSAGCLLCPKALSWGLSAPAKSAVDLSWLGRSAEFVEAFAAKPTFADRCWWSLCSVLYGVGILRLGLFSLVGGCCLWLVSISRFSPLDSLFCLDEFSGFAEGHVHLVKAKIYFPLFCN
jgi:hypothetical protein